MLDTRYSNEERKSEAEVFDTVLKKINNETDLRLLTYAMWNMGYDLRNISNELGMENYDIFDIGNGRVCFLYHTLTRGKVAYKNLHNNFYICDEALYQNINQRVSRHCHKWTDVLADKKEVNREIGDWLRKFIDSK